MKVHAFMVFLFENEHAKCEVLYFQDIWCSLD